MQILYSYNVSCEFDEFRVDSHLCKLRIKSIARPFSKFLFIAERIPFATEHGNH